MNPTLEQSLLSQLTMIQDNIDKAQQLLDTPKETYTLAEAMAVIEAERDIKKGRELMRELIKSYANSSKPVSAA